jgi:hypothetical protein
MWQYRASFRCGHVIDGYKSRTKKGRSRFQQYAKRNSCPICKIMSRRSLHDDRPLSSKERDTIDRFRPRIVALVG